MSKGDPVVPNAAATCLTLTLMAALLLTGAPLYADEYVALGAPASEVVPEGTSTRANAFPRYVPTGVNAAPDRETARELARTWAAAAEAVALERPGTQLAVDLLFGAAAVHRRGAPAADIEAYRRLAQTAVDACQPDDPVEGAALVGLAREELAAGNVPVAGRWLERAASSWAAVVASYDGTVDVPARIAALSKTWTETYLPTRARWLEAEGRDADAAATWSTLAERSPRGQARHWRRAAEAHVRAKQMDDAGRAIERAIEAAPSDGVRGEHHVWRFYAKHGLLDARGRPRELVNQGPWPKTKALALDLAVLLSALSNLEGTATLYLELGSRAHLANDDATALEIYLAAMDNPYVVQEAHGQSAIWEGLLVAFPAAIKLKRFEDAERILETVARIGSIPAERFERLLVWLKKRRADAAEVEAFERRIAEEAQRRREAERTPETPRTDADATLEVEADDLVPVVPPEPEPESTGAPRWLYLLIFVGVLALLIVVFTRP
ncbi:MAG: hypothetical protein QNJ98_02970 [Planctomycetota bacterium]|nr:hypothetical protein [Planctomycetota bacterium]